MKPDLKRLLAPGPLVFIGVCACVGLLVALLPGPGGGGSDEPLLRVFAGEPSIRVLLLRGDEPRRVTVRGGPFDLVTPSGKQRLPGAACTLELAPRGLRLDGAERELPLEIAAADAGPLGLDERRYPGRLRIVKTSRGPALLNELKLESYIEGVIFPEMGVGFPDEALMAQAVASRSYAVHHLLTRRSRTWQVRADQRSQVYAGIPRHERRAGRLVAATRGLVLVSGGRVVPGFFSSTCGGATRSAHEAFGGRSDPLPLQGVTCTWCRRAVLYRWHRGMPVEELRRRLGWRDPILRVGALEHSDSGRLRSLELIQDTDRPRLPLSRLRQAWRGLPSSWITAARVQDGRLELEGRGFGHGVGLCQEGARSLARAGRDRVEILAYYFPGARLAQAWSPEP